MAAECIVWLLPILVAVAIFLNHYARDSVGALQVQMEQPPLNITASQYGTMNSFYFLPNMVMPIVAGSLGQAYGAPNVWVCVTTLACIGHMLFGIGMEYRTFSVMLLGRIIAGIAYEANDVVPIAIVTEALPGWWDIFAGLINGFLRLGSVANFVVTPYLYNRIGTVGALWVASILGGFNFVIGITLKWVTVVTRKPPKILDEELSSNNTNNKVQWREFSLRYWVYLVAGALIYGGIVPFWFFGSKFIQQKWGFSLQAADAVTLFPEGLMVIIAPALGFTVKQWSSKRRLRWMASGCFLTFFAYLLLVFTHITPWVSVAILGASYAISNYFFWSAIAPLSPPSQMSFSCGLVGAATNAFPGILPYPLSVISVDLVMFILGVISGVAGVASLVATWFPHEDYVLKQPEEQKTMDEEKAMLLNRSAKAK